MTNRELLASRIDYLAENDPEFRKKVAALVESKHLSTHPGAKHRDSFLRRHHQRYRSQTLDKEEKRTKEAILSALGVAGLSRRLGLRLTGVLTQAEKYLQAAEKAEDSYTRQLNAQKFTAQIAQAKNELRTAWIKSYRLGVASSGVKGRFLRPGLLSLAERKWIDSAWKQEMKFFSGLADAVKQGRSVPSLKNRVKMYSTAIMGAFSAGQVMSTDKDTMIFWVVNPTAEHCVDCLTLQSLSPYTKDTLPTTPKAGLCRCRSNCKCHLEYESATAAEAEQIRKTNYSKRYILDRIRRRDMVKRKGL